MRKQTSTNSIQNRHPYVVEAIEASKTAIEWSSSMIKRTPQREMIKGEYGPDRVQIFIGDTCTWDSDFPTFTFGNDGHIFKVKDVAD